MLRRPIDLKEIGATEVEISICQAEMLVEKWSNEDSLCVVPHFWRGTPSGGEYNRYCVAIMKGNIIIVQGEILKWIPIHNIDGPPLFSFPCPFLGGQGRFKTYMDLGTGTLHLMWVLQNSLYAFSF